MEVRNTKQRFNHDPFPFPGINVRNWYPISINHHRRPIPRASNAPVSNALLNPDEVVP